MLRYSEVSQNPVKFLALTGYTVEEFLALLPHFRSQFEASMKVKTLDGRPRLKRRYTDYRNSPLPTIEDKLLFILVYLKQETIQEVHASLFGMHQPDANQWIHLLPPILNQALAALGELPGRDAEALHLPETSSLEEGNVAVYFHDGTERPVPRPQNPQAQKLYYSGKKNSTRSRTSWSATSWARSSS